MNIYLRSIFIDVWWCVCVCVSGDVFHISETQGNCAVLDGKMQSKIIDHDSRCYLKDHPVIQHHQAYLILINLIHRFYWICMAMLANWLEAIHGMWNVPCRYPTFNQPLRLSSRHFPVRIPDDFTLCQPFGPFKSFNVIAFSGRRTVKFCRKNETPNT